MHNTTFSSIYNKSILFLILLSIYLPQSPHFIVISNPISLTVCRSCVYYDASMSRLHVCHVYTTLSEHKTPHYQNIKHHTIRTYNITLSEQNTSHYQSIKHHTIRTVPKSKVVQTDPNMTYMKPRHRCIIIHTAATYCQWNRIRYHYKSILCSDSVVFYVLIVWCFMFW
jgi:hypothetical protein